MVNVPWYLQTSSQQLSKLLWLISILMLHHIEIARSDAADFGAAKNNYSLMRFWNQIVATRLPSILISIRKFFFPFFAFSLFAWMLCVFWCLSFISTIYCALSSYAFIWVSSRFVFIFICSFAKMKMMRLFHSIWYQRSALFCVCVCVFLQKRANEYFFCLFVCLLVES